MAKTPRGFFWYELMTSDVKAAEAFYGAVVGWRGEKFGGGSMNYTVMNAVDRGVTGIMDIPEDAKAMGAGPSWLGYIYTDNVDDAADNLKKAGGVVHRPPSDIPEVGRFAVVADPQGATFMLMKPNQPDQPPVPLGTPGHIGWHELLASDWKSAFDFYAGQFGWTKGDAMDMGAMGTYQLFATGKDAVGGIMTKPANIPAPYWLFYFNVPALDPAAATLKEKGGTVLLEPMEVPGGGWIVQAKDPQGAVFALMAAKR
jgi:predicted enzyme related to lactoylglutathione lyase